MKLIGYLFRHIIPIGLLVGVGLLIFGAATPPPSSRIDGIGADLLSSPSLTPDAVEAQLDTIQATGAQYVRIEVNWTLIETSQDVYNWSNVMPLDLFFSSAKTHNLKTVAVITGFPTYLSSMGTSLDQKTLGARWEKFIQAAVDHFGDQVDYWQIGDQINSTTDSRSLAQGNPTFYANMLIAANKIIKKADLSNKVWMGSLVSATASNCAVNPLTFILDVNSAKGWNAADAITYQPERGPVSPENPSTVSVNQNCGSSMPGNSTSLSAEVKAVQDLVRQLGKKPVYITGLVWNPDELVTMQKNRSLDANTLESDLLVRSSVILMGTNSIPLVFWQIDPVNQPASMASMTNLTTLLSESKYIGPTQGLTGSVQEFRFQKGAEVNSFAWRTQDGDAPQPVNISGFTAGKMIAFAANTLSLENSAGTPIQVDSSGSTTIMLNERPAIFIGKVGGWQDQIKAAISDQTDIWRIGIQQSIADWLNRQKAAFMQWLTQLFNKAKDSAVDWGEEKIKQILN